jgi:thiol-disulfide isomerase/thioredoxin
MRLVTFFAIAFITLSCTTKPAELKTGTWRGVIEMQGQQLAFTFDVQNKDGKYEVLLKNGTEKLLLDEVTVKNDSVKMVLHIFDAALQAKIDGDQLTGAFVKNYAPGASLPFTATYGLDYRYEKTSDQATVDFNGKYAVTFIGDKQDTTVAVGIFNQKGNHVEGTFLTPTGDYRYLEGSVVKDKLYLSTFDGNHSFIFSATKKNDNTLTGDYWSGKTSHETWTAIKDDNAALPNAESLTYLKPGFDKISFSFPDVNKNQISPSDEKYKGKVLILQIFGTWCPNCMDETKFLAPWYQQNKDRGVEILGLAYERKDDFDYASARIQKMKEKFGVSYDFVVAGVNDKQKASLTLPMLNRIVAFPTTIFIGKDGKVKAIRTGFEGPGTGIYYDQFKERFNTLVNELLSEKD